MKKIERASDGDSSTLGWTRELTNREKEIVQLVAIGYKNREVAEKLGIAVKTVETHRANIMNKLALRNIAQLIRYAIQKGMVSIEVE